MKHALSTSWHHLESICTLGTDSPEERRSKITLVVITSLCTVAGMIWGTLYYAILGPVIAAYLAYGFSVVVGTALLIFFITKRFNLLLYVFFFMVLWTPIAIQWTLGGFAASGVLMSWSLLAPLCALMFQGIRKALWWLSVYLGLLFISLYFDDYFLQGAFPISHQTSMLFFGMNIIGPSLVVFFTMMYYVNAFQKEHERSEKLLLNILPSPIAKLLKEEQGIIADGFSGVTILFADIVNFTKLSERISPQELVVMLNKVFSAFDRLAQQHGLEKIKTIGDAYMVVGGLPEPRSNHAEAVAEMALGMQAAITSLNTEIGESISIRIGINTGPVSVLEP